MTDPRRKSRGVPANPYQVLGVSPYATVDQIRRAYRVSARGCHPDVNPPEKKAWAEAQMARLNEARGLLTNPIRRAQYDAAHPPPAPAKPAPPIEPIDPAQLKINLRGDPEMRRRAGVFWTGIGLALALIAAGVYYGLIGADNAPQPVRALGEFVGGERVLSLGGFVSLNAGELALLLLGILLISLPITWLWLRR